jgi:uncharacterized protein YndB with AHSA1/START domain
VSVTDPARTIDLQVRVAAAPAEVFRFFIEPELYVQWQGMRAELDPRPGGVFRVWMDADTVARGEYVEVDAPTRLVFTWGWEGDPNVPPGSTTVEVTLEADGEETIVRLRHRGLPDEETVKTHDEGWKLFIGRLALAAAR